MSISLYHISKEIGAIINRLEAEEDDERIEELMHELDRCTDNREEKLDGCCAYVKNLKAHAEAVAVEVKRLQEKQRALEKTRERFLSYMAGCLGSGALWKSELHSLSWRKSESVEIDSEDNIPLGYLRVKTEPDKTKIKDALKSGEVIEGVRLKLTNNLQVR